MWGHHLWPFMLNARPLVKKKKQENGRDLGKNTGKLLTKEVIVNF